MRAPMLVLALSTLLCSSVALATEYDEGIEVDPALFGAVRARSIGPAVMGGRVAALDVVDPHVALCAESDGVGDALSVRREARMEDGVRTREGPR